MTVLERGTTATSGTDPRYRTQAMGTTLNQSLAFTSPWERAGMPLLLEVGPSLASASWFPSIRASVERVASFQPGWNGGKEQQVSLESIRRVVEILNFVAAVAPSPSLVPVSDGSLQIEWHRRNGSLQVEVGITGEAVAVAYSDADGDDEVEWNISGHQGPDIGGLMLLLEHVVAIAD